MKSLIMGVAILGMSLSGAAMAGPLKGHPNLKEALGHLQKAKAKVGAAQTANEFDMEGHAAKAKELIDQAEGELVKAAEAANENKK